MKYEYTLAQVHSIAQTTALITSRLHEGGIYDTIYEKIGDLLSGFPGVALEIGKAAIAFEEAWESLSAEEELEYLDALESYTADVARWWSHEYALHAHKGKNPYGVFQSLEKMAWMHLVQLIRAGTTIRYHIREDFTEGYMPISFRTEKEAWEHVDRELVGNGVGTRADYSILLQLAKIKWKIQLAATSCGWSDLKESEDDGEHYRTCLFDTIEEAEEEALEIRHSESCHATHSYRLVPETVKEDVNLY